MIEKLARIDGAKPVRKTMADGSVKTFYYHRKTGRRLPDDPTSTAFKIAMEQNEREVRASEKAVTAPATIASLIRQYQASNDWTKLAPYTREIEQFHLNAIEDEFGDMPLAAVEARGSRSLFLEWRDELAVDTPRAADAKLVRLARVLKFGHDREIITRHPLSSFPRVYNVDRSEVLWLPAHFEKLNAVANPPIKLAAFVALHTGQRRGDLLALRWSQYDGAGLSLVQQKTKAKVYVPCTKALKATLDELQAVAGARAGGAEIGALHVLNSTAGVPWTIEAFKQAWRYAMISAAIPAVVIEQRGKPASFDLHFHDIRGTAVTMLAEGGCSVPEIASITGHTLASATRILETYLSATRALATAAIAKLEVRMAG